MIAGESQYIPAKLTGTSNIHRSITFSDLPVEIHRLIFINLDSIEDILCLALTSRQYLWAIGLEYMHCYYASFLGRWAGVNIVCVGEDVRAGDFPPKLFSVEEVDELNQKTIDEAGSDDGYWDESNDSAKPFTLYHFSLPTVSDPEETDDVRIESSGIYLDCRKRSKHRDPAFQLASRELLVSDSNYLPQDEPWILRNLTTKEIVRSEAIALKPEFVRGPHIDVLGFGHAVLSRICWSTSPSLSTVDPRGTTSITRGVWAGHCFDITTLARHESETEGVTGWSDVSRQVAEEMAVIWESEWGTDWREAVIKYSRYLVFSE
jgi:hypothetical protein